jgi:predicted transcriptional regulator
MAQMAKTDRRKLLDGDKRRVWACVRDLGRAHTGAFIAELLGMDAERCYSYLFSLRTSRYLKFKAKTSHGQRGRFYFDNTCQIPKGEQSAPLGLSAQEILRTLHNLGQATVQMICEESGYSDNTITITLPQLKELGYLTTASARVVDPLAHGSAKAYGLTTRGTELAMRMDLRSLR